MREAEVLKRVPALAGFLLLSVGAGMVFVPAGLIVAGVLLLALDRRL